MSRQAGGQAAAGQGMGSRGPGETKIELDRRRINARIAKLRRQLVGFVTHRDTMRAARRNRAVPAVVIVGYTNAGKSTLLNRITRAGVLVDNQLFATLGHHGAAYLYPCGKGLTIADTVGFVRNLPHELVEAFASTLEEAADADLLVHVVDGSHPDPEGQITAVRSVLAEVGAQQVAELIVVNKADIAELEVLDRLCRAHRQACRVSARTGAGMDELRERIAALLPTPNVAVDVVVPYQRGDLVSRAHDQGRLTTIEHTVEGTHLVGLVEADLAADLTACV